MRIAAYFRNGSGFSALKQDVQKRVLEQMEESPLLADIKVSADMEQARQTRRETRCSHA